MPALAGWGQGDPGTGPGKKGHAQLLFQLIDLFHHRRGAVKESGLPREELFITTKAMTTGYRATKLGIDNSLTEAGLDYFDLMLIHWPMQDDLGTYRALEEAYQAGKLRSIGVSNFNRAQLGEIMANFQTVPVLKDLAAKYDHTTAQVMLRYLT
ncbi:aldo/keto reductase [Limosilactobacillus fermentum]|nr:aldo/keto reductase [Limosilactobacillus fermentum]WLW44654.1 aldo/keto reductase [Limosilactobacillus fermentum]